MGPRTEVLVSSAGPGSEGVSQVQPEVSDSGQGLPLFPDASSEDGRWGVGPSSVTFGLATPGENDLGLGLFHETRARVPWVYLLPLDGRGTTMVSEPEAAGPTRGLASKLDGRVVAPGGARHVGGEPRGTSVLLHSHASSHLLPARGGAVRTLQAPSPALWGPGQAGWAAVLQSREEVSGGGGPCCRRARCFPRCLTEPCSVSIVPPHG